jgi:multidrug resistance protein, MATE family
MTVGNESSPDSPAPVPQPVLPVASERTNLKVLLSLAWPLIVSNSFTTIQITIDRLFLSSLNVDIASSATAAVMLYWLPYVILFSTAGYVATFVAQYTGNGRPERCGPAVWQGIYFSIVGGLAMLLFIPFSDRIFALLGHSPHLQVYESEYFCCLCWFSTPAAITSAISAFLSGRGDSRAVILINVVGTIVNAVLDYFLIFGYCGFPMMGIAGAGWATVAGAWASVITAFFILFRKKYRDENHTHTGWKFEWELFRRLMRFGLPSSAQWALDMTAFNAFVFLTGWFGDGQLAATTLAITISNLAFIPMLGVGQAASVLVGQNLGDNRPDKAEHMAWLGLYVAGSYMFAIAVLYVVIPSAFILPFKGGNDPVQWAQITSNVIVVLWFVAVFSVFDAVNIVFSFALRGAGDTIFVSLVSLAFAWPVMVVPTYLVWSYDVSHGLYWAWGFASAYIMLQATCFMVRFIGGKWKAMRVIEMKVVDV